MKTFDVRVGRQCRQKRRKPEYNVAKFDNEAAEILVKLPP
jgi:hypothetical protein